MTSSPAITVQPLRRQDDGSTDDDCSTDNYSDEDRSTHDDDDSTHVCSATVDQASNPITPLPYWLAKTSVAAASGIKMYSGQWRGSNVTEQVLARFLVNGVVVSEACVHAQDVSSVDGLTRICTQNGDEVTFDVSGVANIGTVYCQLTIG
jgi:hypothetical protein